MAIHVHALKNVRAVLRDRILDDAVVVVEDGLVVSVEERGPAPAGALDGHGSMCLPGLVDCHSDGLEKELSPRPGVTFPEGFALRSYEGKVRAAGVTTMYHGVGFENDPASSRTVDIATRLCHVLDERAPDPDALVDHRILYRLDARDPVGYEMLARRLEEGTAAADAGTLPLVSFEDHTPGQGQYRDVDKFRNWMVRSPKYAGSEVDAALHEHMARREAMLVNREGNLRFLRSMAQTGRIRLVTHDPTEPADIDEARTWPASVAEFPTTVEAARAARAAGLPTVCGAPNVLRGGSHSGNVAAEELVRLDLCSALASDYQPSTLLAAVFALAAKGAASLPAAVRLVTDGPASMLGLEDRGRIEVGRRADLVLVTHDGRWPTVRFATRAATRAATLVPSPA